MTGMPSGRGHKGSVPPRKKRKSTVPTSRTPAFSFLTNTTTSAATATTGDSSTTPVFTSVPDLVSATYSTPSTSQMYGMPSVPRQTHILTHPSPLVHYSLSSTESSSPFELCFVTGNIRVCRGCRQRYPKPPQPPLDLCVRQQEWQEFVPTGSSSIQARFGNVYYHVNTPCIQTRCSYITSDMLVVPAAVAVQLLPVHTELLADHVHRY